LKTLKLTGTRLASIFSGIIPHPLEPFQTAAAARTPCDRTPSLQRALPRCHQHATLLRIVVLVFMVNIFDPGSQEWTKFNLVKIQFRLRRDEHITLIITISLPVPSNNRIANHQNETKLVENGAEQKGSRTSVELGKMHENSCQIQCVQRSKQWECRSCVTPRCYLTSHKNSRICSAKPLSTSASEELAHSAAAAAFSSAESRTI
ncbi:hypothetical protein T4A_9375, partial [Trichinella pseudospiralis]